jgi:glutaredoxin
VELLLFSRPGCHLCEDARAVLERIGAPFTEVDIESDDALHRRYLERIPVVVLDGEELYDFFVDEEDLRARLRAPGASAGGAAAKSRRVPDRP